MLFVTFQLTFLKFTGAPLIAVMATLVESTWTRLRYGTWTVTFTVLPEEGVGNGFGQHQEWLDPLAQKARGEALRLRVHGSERPDVVLLSRRALELRVLEVHAAARPLHAAADDHLAVRLQLPRDVAQVEPHSGGDVGVVLQRRLEQADLFLRRDAARDIADAHAGRLRLPRAQVGQRDDHAEGHDQHDVEPARRVLERESAQDGRDCVRLEL